MGSSAKKRAQIFRPGPRNIARLRYLAVRSSECCVCNLIVSSHSRQIGAIYKEIITKPVYSPTTLHHSRGLDKGMKLDWALLTKAVFIPSLPLSIRMKRVIPNLDLQNCINPSAQCCFERAGTKMDASQGDFLNDQLSSPHSTTW